MGVGAAAGLAAPAGPAAAALVPTGGWVGRGWLPPPPHAVKAKDTATIATGAMSLRTWHTMCRMDCPPLTWICNSEISVRETDQLDGAPVSIQIRIFCTSVSGSRGPVGGILELPVAVPSMVESNGLADGLPGTTTGPSWDPFIRL